ncbi:unnamed protein product [Caenorhabditis brenneri]
MHTRGTYYTSVTTSERSMVPSVVAYPLILLWAASFAIVLGFLAIHFLYRYFIVMSDHRYITGPIHLCTWLTIPIISGVAYAFSIHLFFPFGTELDDIVRNDISKNEGVSREDVIYFGFCIYKKLGRPGLTETNWMSIYGILIITGVLAVSFALLLFFGLKCYWEVEQLADPRTGFSSHTSVLQTQLFHSVVIQTFISIILIFFPSTLVVANTFTGTADRFYGLLATVTISLYPAVAALPSLIMVGPYCEALKDFVEKFSSKSTTAVGVWTATQAMDAR